MAKLCARSLAAIVLKEVMIKQQSLDRSLAAYQSQFTAQDFALSKAICFGVLRYFESLNSQIRPLLDKPIRNKDYDVYALLLVGAYQLNAMRMPEYAALDSVVKASKYLKKEWAKGLINAVLRKYQALQATNADAQVASEHPLWLFQKIQHDWPEQAQAIFTANQQEPPLCIRVNVAKTSREQYLQQLEQQGFQAEIGQLAESAIYIHNKPSDIFQLPGFQDGLCSVQDEAAQMAAFLLNAKPDSRILDACAAPGGKTCHILERVNNQAQLVALDIDENRLVRVQENLSRLQLTAQLKAADIRQPEQWQNESFDYILCDAPCSATGVIRRHPDIKYLRKPEDIKALATQQSEILKSLWPLLKTGGTLLYATCSILPDENKQVISRFIEQQKNAEIQPLEQSNTPCWQLFPKQGGHDGFFYALLKKTGSA